MKQNKRVVIATHVFTYGKSQALNEYLQGKAEVLFIGKPLFGNVFTWAFGALDTFWQVFKTGKKYDLYVGSNNLNSFVGILLRKIGRVKKVIFYTPDAPPYRFKNPLLNRFYWWVDLFCVRQADLVWNNSNRMISQREKIGLPVKYSYKQIEVPMGSHIIEQRPFSKIDRYSVGFVGHLTWDKGLDLLVGAFPLVLEQVPETKLLIIGGGPIEEEIKSKFEKLGLNKRVTFTGYMKDIRDVYRSLANCAVAVAPYPRRAHVQWTDPGKVKVYFSAGLPVVITDVPAIAEEIQEKNCGIMIGYDKNQLASALIKLLKSDETLKSYRENVPELARKYSYDRIFSEALNALEW